MSEQTEPKKWRLLKAGELMQRGDQSLQPHGWQTIDRAYFGDPVEDAEDDAIVRRRMTPAEIHAEELGAALRKAMTHVWKWDESFDDLDGGEWPSSYSDVKSTWDKLFK